ncbi:HEAT repeat domain-containing protein [Pontibacter sp. SGAir0037]|uniref:HEAT repeat domain-containing protein n=1 Tax=Pontibacter sp. SGAir0037 TaxID=2571030 RepID=UPI0010CCEC44|nr:HEAT repeat domain-containing protein [Pontibacter sp. SGAir0037]QCR21531.1 hypothetical protein C1N53_03665 [Pontibacter sp. SGAir0037]
MLHQESYTSFLLIPPALPPLVKLILTLSAAFMVVAILLFLFIVLSRVRDGFNYNRRQLMQKKSQQFITSMIFEEEGWNVARLENFREKYLTNDFQKQLFLENLIILRKNIIGELADKLNQLYKDLGLHIYSKQKLYSGSWDVIAKGIGELTEMGMKQDSVLIRTFINHPNQILRSEAQVSYLKLQNEEPFSFLDELEEPLLEWSQMQLGRAAQKTQFLKLPHFEKWLHKKEPSIVIFCIRMISFYNQHGSAPKLIKMLDHPNEKVRLEAVIAICHLEIYDATEKMLQIFDREPLKVQLEILKTLPNISGEENIPFYEQLLHHHDKSLQLAAAKAIVRSGHRGEEIMATIQNNDQHTLQPVAAYALDKRI